MNTSKICLVLCFGLLYRLEKKRLHSKLVVVHLAFDLEGLSIGYMELSRKVLKCFTRVVHSSELCITTETNFGYPGLFLIIVTFRLSELISFWSWVSIDGETRGDALFIVWMWLGKASTVLNKIDTGATKSFAQNEPLFPWDGTVFNVLFSPILLFSHHLHLLNRIDALQKPWHSYNK